MGIESLVLGTLLLIMGIIQIFLRHGPRIKNRKKQNEQIDRNASTRSRGSRIWELWTYVLGYVGIVFGIVLLVLGFLGK